MPEIIGARYCFRNCANSFKYKDGRPRGWRNIIMYTGKPVAHLSDIKQWTRDGVLCPDHAKAVQDLLVPLGLSAMSCEGIA